MANQESEVLQALNDQAEGEADQFGMEDNLEADAFSESEDAFSMEDSFEADAAEAEADFGEADMGGEAEAEVEAEAEFEADEALVPYLANALGAESEDEFWGGLVNAFKKALPVVGKIARAATPILSAIPFPAAQVAAKVAGLASNLAGEAAEAGEGEDGVMQRAAEAAAEAAVRDRRAKPVVVGLVSRQAVQHRGAQLPAGNRRQVVRQVNHAARVLARAGGPQAIRALPKIMASVNRTADARGTSVAGRLAVLRRSVHGIARRPKLLQKLSQPTARSMRLGRMMRMRTRPGARGNGRYNGYGPGGGAPGYYGSGPGDGVTPGYTRRIVTDGPSIITIRPR
jgi:hypothetical protein